MDQTAGRMDRLRSAQFTPAARVNLAINRVRRVLIALSRRDPDQSFWLLWRIGRWLVPEYRFKRPHMAWWLDDDFTSYLRRFDLLDGLNSDRRWMLQQLVRLVGDVPGNTAECGSYRGASSYLIARMNQAGWLKRKHYAIDSFEGLSPPESVDGSHWERGDLAATEAELRANLHDFSDQLVVCKGWIPDSFAAIEPQAFAFVHVDVDLYAPTKASLEFFYPLLSPGGIVLIDDYGSTHCPGATRAADEFLSDKPEKMIALSSGAGFFVKGVRTQPPLHPLPAETGRRQASGTG
jgi:hypothetical protein